MLSEAAPVVRWAHNDPRSWEAGNDYPHLTTTRTGAQRGVLLKEVAELGFTPRPSHSVTFTALLCVRNGGWGGR